MRSHPEYTSSDIARSVRWRLEDYGWIAEEQAGGQIMRTMAHSARGG